MSKANVEAIEKLALGVGLCDRDIDLFSIAISLKRIADAVEASKEQEYIKGAQHGMQTAKRQIAAGIEPEITFKYGPLTADTALGPYFAYKA